MFIAQIILNQVLINSFVDFTDALLENIDQLEVIDEKKKQIWIWAIAFNIVLISIVQTIRGKLNYFDRKNTSVMLIMVEMTYIICNIAITVFIYIEV